MSYKIRRSFYQATIKLMLLSLITATLAGLIPAPLVRSVLPAALAEPVAALLPVVPSASAAPLAPQTSCLAVDEWTDAQEIGGTTTSSVVSGAGILGGERDMFYTDLTPSDGNGIIAKADPTFFLGFPALDIANGPGRFSKLTVVWDGADGDATTLAPNGLGGANLLAGGATAFTATITTDSTPAFSPNLPITLTVYDSSGGVSQQTISVTPANSVYTVFSAPFASFVATAGGGANFAQVGAISMVIDMTNRDGWDVTLTRFGRNCHDDYGDLPDTSTGTATGDYQTLAANNGPSHGIAAILRMGAQIDGEADGQPNATADGDDTTGTPDDEDGVQFKTPLRPGAKAVVSVGTSQPLSTNTRLNAWIDFNQDGDFADAGEQIATDSLVFGNAIRTDVSNATVDFDIPSAALSGFTYARFRLCTAIGVCNSPTGAAVDGEVEDYRVQIESVAKLGDYVWLDNGDGIQQSGEPGIPGVLVKLYRASDNVLVDVVSTDASGLYLFPGVQPDTYYVEFVAPSGYTFTLPNQGADPAKNSDADQTTGRTSNITLAGGADDRAWDAGLIATASQLTVCEALPWGKTEVIHTFSLPKFNPALGTLTAVSLSSYQGLRQWIGYENTSVNPQTSRVTTTSDGLLTLPDNATLNTTVGVNTGNHTLAAYDGIADYSGLSSFSYSDWQYAFNAASTPYTPVADFIAASPGQSVNLPFETLSGFSIAGGGGNINTAQNTDALAGVCVNYSYTPAPPATTIQIIKKTTGGNGSFGYTSPNATLDAIHLTTVGGTASSAVTSLAAGSYTISEDQLVGWSLTSLTCTGDTDNGSVVTLANRRVVIDLDTNENIVCTFSNTAQPSSVTPSNVLTLTKTVIGNAGGVTSYAVTVNGPSGYVTNTTVTAGVNKVLTGLTGGIYTVTETSPGAGWVTTYTVSSAPATVLSGQAVVNLTNASSIAAFAAVPVSGRVFRDFNSDGLITANGTITDTGVLNVKVTAYGVSGAACGTATSNATGNYSFTPTCAGPWRLVFSDLPAGYEPTTHGTQNGTSTQFVTTATQASGVNLGVLIPCNYCQANPSLALPVHKPGNSGASAFNIFSYEAVRTGDGSGIPQALSAATGVENPVSLATPTQIGTTWGTAYQGNPKRLFVTSLLRRHAAMADGPGYIYMIDPVSGYLGKFNLAGVAPSNGGAAMNFGSVTRVSSTGADNDVSQQLNRDLDAFAKAGKMAFGDADFDDSSNTLWTVNLFDKTLIAIDVSGSTASLNGASAATLSPLVKAYSISGLSGVPSCSGGTVRPWGLGFYLGSGYLGVTCDASTSGSVTDLDAYVLSFDPENPTAGFTPALTFGLNYNRELVGAFTSDNGNFSTWRAWTDDWNVIKSTTMPVPAKGPSQVSHHMPLVSDVEFRDDGAMVVGLLDRNSMMFAANQYEPIAASGFITTFHQSAGDIILACNVSGSFVLEGTGGCAVNDNGSGSTVQGAYTVPQPTNVVTDGPSNSGEFFYNDNWVAGSGHNEVALGSVAVLHGKNEVVSTVYDPLGYDPFVLTNPFGLETNGIHYYDASTGQANDGYLLLERRTGADKIFSKAGGLGDLEILCDPAPIEIGNRVWNDLDGDGVQDANEPGIANITVSLQGPTNTVTTNTDANGLYYFGNLKTNSAYTLTITPPAGYSLTAANQAALSGTSVGSNHAISDTLDSDAALISSPGGGQVGAIYYSTGSAGQNNHGLDFGFTQPVTNTVNIFNKAPPALLGAIGNYVWVDENSDGRQDEGEPGIPNVRLVLKDSVGNPVAETRTDSSGHYLFPNLPLGSYLVDVDETTLPAGLTQTPPSTLPNADFGNQDQSGAGYPASINATAPENLTGDFGYNYNPQPEVINPLPGNIPAALGDRVWIDSDKDGQQDPAEIGIPGVILRLYTSGPDGVFGTPDDVLAGTDTTDVNGLYLFDNLPAGAYVVKVDPTTLPLGYVQSGDPDHFATTGVNDNRTTQPVILGPGDVFLNVDFGYNPTNPAVLGSIGDTVWFDADADGNGPSLAPVDGGAPVNQGSGLAADAIDYGIPGVTVSLIKDLNGDGLWQAANEPVIASDLTDSQGQYLFPGLPLDDGGGDGDADYIVWVNDTDNVLAGLKPTYDKDGLATLNRSVRAINAATPNPRDQDFGYTPTLQQPGLGAIGDTIWLDVDNSGGNQGTQGNEPGIEGVLVTLTDSNGQVKSTLTDENGHYYFAGLPLSQTYTVTVLPVNFQPGGVLAGLHETFDPDGGTPSQSVTTLTAATPIRLDQDFSYVATTVGQIGNLVWLDPNANGLYEAALGETPIGGVTVDLYRDLNGNGKVDPGEPRLGSSVTTHTITPASFGTDGNYIFSGLPGGTYVVDVSDRDGVLAGTWHSRGTDSSNNHSQSDPYAVNLPSGGENLTADFGYYKDPAAVGNYVWFDPNVNGLQEANEKGINGITVTLTITYPNGAVTVVKTTTMTDPTGSKAGWYSFGNLLQDENYNGALDGNPVTSEPQHSISVATPPGYAPTLVDVNANGNDKADSDKHSGVLAAPVKGQLNTLFANDAAPIASYDFGFVPLLSLGNRVWRDNGAGGGVANNGLQDGGEPGVANVLVNLLDAAGNPARDANGNLVPAEVTDGNGYYRFDKLLLGDYLVAVDASNFALNAPLDNWVSSTGNSTGGIAPDVDTVVTDKDDNGNDVLVGGAIRSNLVTLAYNSEPLSESDLGPGDATVTPDGYHNLTVDFGFYQTVNLGNLVWLDVDNDGQKDANETGIDGVAVQLFKVGDNPLTATPVLTDVTSVGGFYNFANLTPGQYFVYLPTPPAAYPVSSTPTDSADNGQDNDDNGTQAASGQPVRSPDVDLQAGQEPASATDGDDTDGDQTVDFGFFAPVTVGDYVWFDNNRNGSQDGGSESGVPGVKVTLFNSDGTPAKDIAGNLVAVQTTGSNGQYLFSNLPPGDYLVQFDKTTLPTGYNFTTPNAAGVPDANDSDANLADGKTGNTGFLPSGGSDLTLDAGIFRPVVTVGDLVWYDNNRNGLYEAGLGEAGVVGVQVTLYNASSSQPQATYADGSAVTPLNTDATGNYLFTNLPPGSYYVVFNLATLPPGYLATTKDVNGNAFDDQDSDADRSSGQTAATPNLGDGQQDLTLDLGIFSPVAVGDYVWYDNNHDGSQGLAVDEPGVAGVKVTLFKADGTPVTQNAVGQPIVPLLTDNTGHYIFQNLPPGSYSVQFDLATLPTGYLVTTPDVNGNSSDAQDSDADATGKTAATPLLTNGDADLTLDLGIFAPVGVGDYVWFDDNGDGVQTNGELGVAGVKVTLFKADGTPAQDVAGNPVAVQTTDANGGYLFTNLPPGSYAVQFDPTSFPAGSMPTTPNVGGDDTLDSDADSTGKTPATGPIPSGQANLTLDLGLVRGVKVGDYVWYDSDKDGVQDVGEVGVPGVKVTLFNGDGTPAKDLAGTLVPPQTTDASGKYLFSNLPPGAYAVQFDLTTLPTGYVVTTPNNTGDAQDSDASASDGKTAATPFIPGGSQDLTLDMGIYQLTGVRVGDYVWIDQNANGSQESGEVGVPGVKVTLFNATTNQPVLDANNQPVTDVTDGSGLYLFADLPAGSYFVQFDLSTLPGGYVVTKPNVGDDATDSDGDASGKTGATANLSVGQQDLTLDLGIYQPASLGDYVWNDRDADGVQETGELPVPNVTVTLFNGDGTPAKDAQGNPLPPTTTDANGHYHFTNLPPGDYYVQFTPPAGYSFTSPNQGSDDAVDSDAAPLTGKTVVTTLVSGENDPTWDAGLYIPAAIGNYVWADSNGNGLQEPGEPAIAGVTVTLYDGTGLVIDTTTTDQNGFYGFTGLTPGDYSVGFQPPAGYVPTQPNQGSDDTVDSDADVATGRTPVTTLTPGENDPTWDAGLTRPASIGSYVWDDGAKETANGIKEPGEPGVAGVTVILLNPASQEIGRTVTGSDGSFLFSNLTPGQYSLKFVLGNGMEFTIQAPTSTPNTNNDANPANGETAVTTLQPGQNDLSWGAGILTTPTALPEEEEPTGGFNYIYLPTIQR